MWNVRLECQYKSTTKSVLECQCNQRRSQFWNANAINDMYVLCENTFLIQSLALMCSTINRILRIWSLAHFPSNYSRGKDRVWSTNLIQKRYITEKMEEFVKMSNVSIWECLCGMYVCVCVHKATPIKFPVSHPLAHQKYLLHQNKNTIQFQCALIFEALGFKKNPDFNTQFILCFLSCVCFFTSLPHCFLWIWGMRNRKFICYGLTVI